MPSTSIRTAQTTSEVKKQHKQNGLGISTQQHKHLLRGHELDERAARHREAESRRRAAKEKRAERLQKEDAARRQIGVGLATQLVGYSHTQAQLKNGMEAFLGLKKKKEEAKRAREVELARTLEVIAQAVEKEAWDDEGAEDGLLDLPQDTGGEELWADDDLDDDTLLEAHELVMSDPVEEPPPILHAENRSPAPAATPKASAISAPTPATISITNPIPVQKPAIPAASPSIPAAVPSIPTLIPTTVSNTTTSVAPKPAKPTSAQTSVSTTVPSATQALVSGPLTTPTAIPSPANDETTFARIHGPINKAIETVLDKMSAPLVELLSQDVSSRLPEWDPPASLLHKLSPVGLPPHRLRIKVGCVVTLLRDLNTSSQLSKSQHLRVLRVGNDRIECQVLDGQLEGTKAILTRVPFMSKYRNEDGYPFQRTQFPIRISTDYTSSGVPQDPPQSGFKLPTRTGQLQSNASRRPLPPPSAKPIPRMNSNPSFKLPGLPASKAQSAPLKPIPNPNISTPTIPFGLDGWDDFLESGTQIARELSAETKPASEAPKPMNTPTPVVDSVPPLSTQDLDFSLDDLEEESTPSPEAPEVVEVAPPVKMPATVPPGLLSRAAQLRRSASLSTQKRTAPHQLKRKPDTLPPPNMLPPAKKPDVHPNKSKLEGKLVKPPSTNMLPPTEQPHVQPVRPVPQTKPAPVIRTRSSFSELGLSTQDAAFFFDDEDDYDDGDADFASVV